MTEAIQEQIIANDRVHLWLLRHTAMHFCTHQYAACDGVMAYSSATVLGLKFPQGEPLSHVWICSPPQWEGNQAHISSAGKVVRHNFLYIRRIKKHPILQCSSSLTANDASHYVSSQITDGCDVSGKHSSVYKDDCNSAKCHQSSVV